MKLLTDHEIGSALTSIEWVARSGKPICEAGSRSVSDSSGAELLKLDVAECIAMSGEQVSGFVYEQMPKVWTFGFYAQPWAYDALRFLMQEEHRFDDYNRRWLFGLLFGYSPESIQRFMARSGLQEPTLPHSCTFCRVGTFHSLTEQSAPHNSTLTETTAMPNAFGDFIKRARAKKGETLRDFCVKHGFDPGNFSRMERGMSPPPQREELLEKYAAALGFKRNTDDWIEFFDLAAATHGQLPKDLLTEDELIGKLPVLFRTLRGSKVPTEKLDDLIEMIRKGV